MKNTKLTPAQNQARQAKADARAAAQERLAARASGVSTGYSHAPVPEASAGAPKPLFVEATSYTTVKLRGGASARGRRRTKGTVTRPL